MHLLDTDIGEHVDLDGRLFHDSGFGDWVGFYDWLRSSSGKILGVRSWLEDEEIQGIRNRIADSTFVEWSDTQLRLWFSNQRLYEERLSGDQALGTHRILMSSDGEIAIGFDVDDLSQVELDMVIAAAVDLRSSTASVD